MKIAPFEMKFTIPTGQGKNIYSPLQRIIGEQKIQGLFACDRIELSCFKPTQVEKVLNTLADLKAKFKMDTKLF